MPVTRDARRGPSSMSLAVSMHNTFDDNGVDAFGAPDAITEDQTFDGTFLFTRVAVTSRGATRPDPGWRMPMCGETAPLEDLAAFLLKESCSPCAPCNVTLECVRSAWQMGGHYTRAVGGVEAFSYDAWGRALLGYVATGINEATPRTFTTGDPLDAGCTIARATAGDATHNESQIVTFDRASLGGVVSWTGARKLQWIDPDGATHYFRIEAGASLIEGLANQPFALVTDASDVPIETPSWLLLSIETDGARFTWVGQWGLQPLSLATVQALGMGEEHKVSQMTPVLPRVQVWFQWTYRIDGDDPPSDSDPFFVSEPTDPTSEQAQESYCPASFLLSQNIHSENTPGPPEADTVNDLQLDLT